jgi:hypothetical protein
MKSNLPRRSFLARLGLVAGTAIAARFTGMAKCSMMLSIAQMIFQIYSPVIPDSRKQLLFKENAR